jgi:hypothetical protein
MATDSPCQTPCALCLLRPSEHGSEVAWVVPGSSG